MYQDRPGGMVRNSSDIQMQTQTVIAVVNEKGGTGKTTTAVSLSAALGQAGKEVLLVDLDGQAASSRWLGVEDDNRLSDAMCRGKGLEPIRHVLPGVSLAPASGKLDSVAHDLRPTQGGQLRKLLSELSGYDFVIIDCPPSLGNRLIGNALLSATHVIVPVETSILALDGLRILLTTLDDVREGFGHELILGGVLACRYDPRTRLSRLVLAELRRALPGKVFQTIIRENVKMRECPASGQSILSFAPESHAALDYQALAKEMLETPTMWREPAALNAQAGGADGGGLENLRQHAAAAVRDAVKKASGHKDDDALEDDAVDAIQEDPQVADAACDGISHKPEAIPPVAIFPPKQEQCIEPPTLVGEGAVVMQNHEAVSKPSSHGLADDLNSGRQAIEEWITRLNDAQSRLGMQDINGVTNSPAREADDLPPQVSADTPVRFGGGEFNRRTVAPDAGSSTGAGCASAAYGGSIAKRTAKG